MTGRFEPVTAIRVKTRMAAAALAAIAGLLLGAPTAGAQSSGNPAVLETTASVDIWTLITITEDSALNFGTIVKPTDVSFVDYKVDEVTGDMIVSDGSSSALGGHARGFYDFTGETGEAFLLTTSFNGCPGSGGNILFTALTANIVVPLRLPLLDLAIGGTLRVFSSVAPGDYECIYTLKAEYD